MYSSCTGLSTVNIYICINQAPSATVEVRQPSGWVTKHKTFKRGSGVRVPEHVKVKTQDFPPGNGCSCPVSTYVSVLFVK